MRAGSELRSKAVQDPDRNRDLRLAASWDRPSWPARGSRPPVLPDNGAPRLLASTRRRPDWMAAVFLAGLATLTAGLGSMAPPHWFMNARPNPLAFVSLRSTISASTEASAVVPEPQLATRDETSLRAVDPKPDTYTVNWPYDILDGLTFGPEGAAKTHLSGLEGPARDAVCNDKFNQPWACGLQARAALNNVTRRQTLTCTPLAPFQPGSAIPARCTGEIDVARELVTAGFARPTSRNPDLEQAEDDARRNERGLWNGGWTVRISAR